MECLLNLVRIYNLSVCSGGHNSLHIHVHKVVLVLAWCTILCPRGQRRAKKRDILQKQQLLQAELLLVEQQKLLLKEKQKLLEASQNENILKDDKELEEIVEDQDVVKPALQETVFENPTEDDIKCLTRDPKPSSEKKKD